MRHQGLNAGAAAAMLSLLRACGPAANEPAGGAIETLQPWPFTVSEVILSCGPTPPGAIFVVTTPDGRRFAVSGSARSEAPLMRDIQAVVELQPLVARGRLLCADGGQVRLFAPPPPSQDVGPPTYRVEDDRIGGGFLAIAEANDIIAGARPELALGCAPGQRHFVKLHLISRWAVSELLDVRMLNPDTQALERRWLATQWAPLPPS